MNDVEVQTGVELVMPEQRDQSHSIRELFSLPLEKSEIAFVYLGYAGVILRVEGRTIAIDIGSLLGDKEIAAFDNLDLLVFTHNHWDHYDPKTTIKMLEKTDSLIVAQQQVAEDLENRVPPSRLALAKTTRPLRVGDFEVVAINGVHPRPISIYRIRKDEISIFHGGDSGYVPVKNYPARIAFLPTGTPSPSCSPKNALRFTLDLRPNIAIAMHGTPTQMRGYKKLVEKDVPQTAVIIPKKYKAEIAVL